MAELLGVAEVVVVHGFVIGEATGRAIRVPDPSEDAEEGDTVVAPVTATPVALAEQKTLPMLRALAAHGHIQAQPITTTPDPVTGYYALACLSTNDPDVEPYAGRRVTLPDGTERVISLPHNALATTVDERMAAQVNRLPDGTTRTPPLVSVGQSVRAVWLPDAADYVAPELLGPSYYTAEQVDSIVDGLLADAITAADLEARLTQLLNGAPAALDTLGEIATRLASDSDAVAALTNTVAGKVAKADWTAKGDILVRNTAGQVVPLHVSGTNGRALLEDDTVAAGMSWQPLPTSGGSGGGAAVLTQTPTKTGAYTATVGQAVPLDTTGGAFTLTFPSGAPVGSQVAARWAAGTAPPTVSAPTGETIGAAQTATLVLPPGTTSGQFIVWQKWTSAVWLPAGGFTPASLLVPASQRGPIGGHQQLTYAAALSTDAAAGNSWHTTLTGNTTLNTPTGTATPGQLIRYELLASGAARTVTWGTGLGVMTGIGTSLQIPSGRLARVDLWNPQLVAGWVVVAANVTV